MKKKIVRTDDFDRSGEQPGRDEALIAVCENEEYAKSIVYLLNTHIVNISNQYFKVVDENYELKIFKP